MADRLIDNSQDETILLWMGLTNDVLVPDFDGNQQAPVELGSRAAEQLLHAFQQLVYVTVLLRTGARRTTTARLTDRERVEFELVLAMTRTSSFEFGFRRHTNEGSSDHFDENLRTTFEWILDVLVRLEPWSDIVLESAPTVTQIIIESASSIITAQTGYHVEIDPLLAGLAVTVLASWLRNSKQQNRRLRATMSGSAHVLFPTRLQVEGGLNAEKSLNSHQDHRVETEEREFGPAQGIIERVERDSRILHMRFPNSSSTLPCRYDPADQQRLGNLDEGDMLTVSGTAIYLRATNQLLAVQLDDWSDLHHHSYDGIFRL